MKYLKKIFESSILDINNLSDILQELTDLEYKSHLGFDWWSSGENSIEVVIYGKKEYDEKFDCEVSYIYTDEIIDVLERLINFLRTEDFIPDELTIKKINTLKAKPIKKTKYEIIIQTGPSSQQTFRWDERTQKYKLAYNLSLYFKNF
jgi:hypothetical protein